MRSAMCIAVWTLLLGCSSKEEASADAAKAPPPDAATVASGPPVRLNSDDFIAAHEQDPSKAAKKFSGKLVRLKGKLKAVELSGPTAKVSLFGDYYSKQTWSLDCLTKKTATVESLAEASKRNGPPITVTVEGAYQPAKGKALELESCSVSP